MDSSDLPPFLCFDLSLDRKLDQNDIEQAISENPRNIVGSVGPLPTATNVSSNESTGEHLEDNFSSLVVNITRYWLPGRTLKIKFLNGDLYTHRRVRNEAKAWTTAANIKFKWVDDDAPRTDIRIRFVTTGGSKSAVGTACQAVEQSKPTMVLQVGPGSSDKEVRRAVLHEFGHALGCEHEHQSYMADLQWGEKAVFADCAGFWTKAQVDHHPNSISSSSCSTNIQRIGSRAVGKELVSTLSFLL